MGLPNIVTHGVFGLHKTTSKCITHAAKHKGIAYAYYGKIWGTVVIWEIKTTHAD